MSVIDAGRKFHERHIFKDTLTFIRELGEPVFDPNTGTYDAPTRVVYTGRGLVTPITQTRGMDEELGGEIVVTNLFLVKVPADVVGIRHEDRVVVVGAHDPELENLTFRVHQIMGETFEMSRRMVVELISMSEPDESSESSSE